MSAVVMEEAPPSSAIALHPLGPVDEAKLCLVTAELITALNDTRSAKKIVKDTRKAGGKAPVIEVVEGEQGSSLVGRKDKQQQLLKDGLADAARMRVEEVRAGLETALAQKQTVERVDQASSSFCALTTCRSFPSRSSSTPSQPLLPFPVAPSHLGPPRPQILRSKSTPTPVPLTFSSSSVVLRLIFAWRPKKRCWQRKERIAPLETTLGYRRVAEKRAEEELEAREGILLAHKREFEAQGHKLRGKAAKEFHAAQPKKKVSEKLTFERNRLRFKRSQVKESVKTGGKKVWTFTKKVPGLLRDNAQAIANGVAECAAHFCGHIVRVTLGIPPVTAAIPGALVGAAAALKAAAGRE
ncbi:hypothetical protein DACRYDRAFT_100200 [Dacryopinax primogenitus]|uniref:Uncharacterized protein n=1 Tax=Dacryopinax primogenitus (strain DJM 731) TaxID=1858805 RepID=M5FVU2_DACPD|nr:uncharacterized protein DACRYDRAFT_100200 [Dacryopinax primogenitus]EJU01961.1 hypothetical protein DACRYDRAFT_100200 [Dacryopinax primogenitus]